MLRTIFFSFILTVGAFGQSQNRIWRHFPDSTYTAKLIGLSGTNTGGNSYTGTYDIDFNSHYFDVVETGWYNMYFDENGGSSYSLDSGWSPRYIPGSDARTFAFFADSGMTLTELRRLLSAAAEAWVTGGSVPSDYLPDDNTIKLNASDSTFYVDNHLARIDTLQESATPSITSAMYYRALNDTLITITDFTNNPGVNIPKQFFIHVLTDSLVIQDGTINCGTDLGPDSLDTIICEWDGLEISCRFWKFHY